jgi:hypothetical protein
MLAAVADIHLSPLIITGSIIFVLIVAGVSYTFARRIVARARRAAGRWAGVPSPAAIAKIPLVPTRANGIVSHATPSPITVSAKKSGTVVVETPDVVSYFEVAVYAYPEYTHMFSSTGDSVVPLDFLPYGDYHVVVFGIAEMAARVETTQNCSRPRPPTHATRNLGSAEFATAHAASTADIAGMMSSGGAEAIAFESSRVTNSPEPHLTRIERLDGRAAVGASHFVTAVPSFGYVVTDEDSVPLGSLVHERNNTAFYVSDNSEGDVLAVHIVYPNIDPRSSISPKPTVYAYAPNPEAARNLPKSPLD